MLDGMGELRAVPVALAVMLAASASDAGPAQTSITVFASGPAAPNPYAAYGGLSYGGYTNPTGAMITERREVDISQNGEVRITGIASTLDPATVQLRSLTDPTGVTVSEQRFVPGASSPDEILARHVGDQVTIVTPKGEVSGVLRSVDPQALVIEAAQSLQVLRRDGYVQDIRLPAKGGVDKASLVWRLAAKKPGKHNVEVTYRADGLTWAADYLAIFDEAQNTIDFSAWATLKNSTGTSFDNAELTLVSGGQSGPVMNPYGQYGQLVQRPSSPITRYTVPSLVRVGNGESVQVELVPTRVGAKARSVVTFEAVQDVSATYQAYPATDCTLFSASVPGSSRAEIAVEVDVPAGKQLPDGRVRVFKRPAKSPERLEVLGEDQLHAGAGVARIKLATHTEVTGERRATACNIDERARTITEKIEVKIENKAKAAADVVVREFMFRSPVWHIDPSDENVKGTKSGPQVQEYRVNLPAGGKKSITYTVTYSW